MWNVKHLYSPYYLSVLFMTNYKLILVSKRGMTAGLCTDWCTHPCIIDYSIMSKLMLYNSADKRTWGQLKFIRLMTISPQSYHKPYDMWPANEKYPCSRQSLKKRDRLTCTDVGESNKRSNLVLSSPKPSLEPTLFTHVRRYWWVQTKTPSHACWHCLIELGYLVFLPRVREYLFTRPSRPATFLPVNDFSLPGSRRAQYQPTPLELPHFQTLLHLLWSPLMGEDVTLDIRYDQIRPPLQPSCRSADHIIGE
jgi:hypothetical protein